MSLFSQRNRGSISVGVLVGVLVLIVGFSSFAQAQEQDQREGIWVDFFFGTDIDLETRTVVGEATTFEPGGGKVFCLTRVHGMSPVTSVTHAWYYEGKTMARVDLTVGSENWRTWSSKSYLPTWTGSWEVKVLDPDGMVLGSAGFEVN